MTDEDLRALVAEAERHGTIETAERRMIAGVLRLGDRPVRGVMTPRGGVDWIDAAAGETRSARCCSAPRIPACRSATAHRRR